VRGTFPKSEVSCTVEIVANADVRRQIYDKAAAKCEGFGLSQGADLGIESMTFSDGLYVSMTKRHRPHAFVPINTVGYISAYRVGAL
jgi:hypothetical protein